MKDAAISVVAPACALALFAGLALAAPAEQRPTPRTAETASTELIPHDQRPGAVITAEPGCLVFQAGVVRTADRGVCLDTLAQTETRMVIQLDGPLTKERAARLEAAGVRLGQYLPTNSYIASTQGVDPDAFAQLDFVRWHGEYQSAWKLAEINAQRDFVTPRRQEIEARGEAVILVSLFQDADPDAAAKAIASLPGMVVLQRDLLGGNPLLTVIAPRGQIVSLTDLDAVMAIEEAPEATPRMATSSWVVQSNVADNYSAHANGLDGLGQIIGVMDLPVDAQNCVFADPGVSFGPGHRKWVAINSNGSPSFHGTAVASMVAGDNNDLPGDQRGIAYKAKMAFSLIPSYSEAALVNSLQLHHSQGARIHTNSWGNDGSISYNVWARAIDVFTHEYEDDLVVFAVTNQSTLRTPENSRNVLAVGATYDAPQQAFHRLGGIGPTADGRRKPEIYAPGNNIIAARPGSCDTTSSGAGTSFAAPQISGAAALVRQYFTDGYYPTGAPNPSDAFTPSGALLKAVLLNSAVNMTGVGGYPSNLEGWGRILLDEALHYPGDARTMMVADVRNASGESLSTGDLFELEFEVVDAAEKLKATMSFTDRAAAPSAAFVPINDLDLELVSPAGDVYRGNVFSGGVSITGGSPDAINNVEQVHVPSPQTGVWTARVLAPAVNLGTQGFAMVITGAVQEPGLPCPADLNGDGSVGSADLGVLLADWNGVGPADLDGDGNVSASDLGILLAAWGACP